MKWLKQANQWQTCINEAERKSTFEKHGVRWTPLLRLPYWDPTQFVVVDSMHNLFLGLFKNHVMSILGIDITLGTHEEPRPATEKEIDSALNILKNHNHDQEKQKHHLTRFRKPVLEEICHLLGAIVYQNPTSKSMIVRKTDLITAIVETYCGHVSLMTLVLNWTNYIPERS
ncbi:MAG TPA: hypothetical protein VGO47_03045 [Chlamydiales bacterium]|nr:hypothetical protein [Chlamydiales bacterium]